MRCIILSSMSCVATPHFPTLLQKRHDFRKKILNVKCVPWFSLQLLSETFHILRRNERDIIRNVHWSSCKVYTRYSLQILMKFEFSRNIFKNTQISNFMKILSLGAKGQTDRHDEGNSRFSQFCWFLGCVATYVSSCVPNFGEKRFLHFECKRASITDWRRAFFFCTKSTVTQPATKLY